MILKSRVKDSHMSKQDERDQKFIIFQKKSHNKSHNIFPQNPQEK